MISIEHEYLLCIATRISEIVAHLLIPLYLYSARHNILPQKIHLVSHGTGSFLDNQSRRARMAVQGPPIHQFLPEFLEPQLKITTMRHWELIPQVKAPVSMLELYGSSLFLGSCFWYKFLGSYTWLKRAHWFSDRMTQMRVRAQCKDRVPTTIISTGPISSPQIRERTKWEKELSFQFGSWRKNWET